MFLCSPLVGHNLIQVPSEDQIENNIEDETSNSVAYHIIVESFTKSRSDLVGLCVEQGLKGNDEGSMRNHADSYIDCKSRVVGVGGNEGENVLDDEEEKRDDHSYFSTGEEHLNEEVLND